MRLRALLWVGYVFFLLGQSHAQSNYLIQTVAGSSAVGDGGSATAAGLAQAEGVSVDRVGNVYIADAGDHRIRCVRPGGMVQTVAGTGTPSFGGDGGVATKAQLSSPYGIHADKWGNLYIADLGNHRVRKLAIDGTITTVAGGGTIVAGPNGDGGPATAVGLDSPRNVLADELGGFYVSDFAAHRVYYVDPRGIIQTVAGTGQPGLGTTSISATSSPLRSPAGMAFDSQGGILIADSGNHQIRRLWRGTISTYSLVPNRIVQLYSPTDIGIDTLGNLWIADDRPNGTLLRAANGDISVLPAGGRALTVDQKGTAYVASGGIVRSVSLDLKGNRVVGFFAGNGGYGYGGDDGAADAARLNWPSAMAQDIFGNLYIADERNHRVRKVAPTGTISTYAGTGLPGYSGDGGRAVSAKLNLPRAVATDRFGNLYIAEAGNNTVRRVSAAGEISTFAGDGFSGYKGDGGYAAGARLKQPGGLAVNEAGELYIADSGNGAVRKVSISGVIATVTDGLNVPRGLAFDARGALYIAESGANRVRRIDTTGNVSMVDSGCDTPRGIAVDREGTLYVSEAGKHRIRRVLSASAFEVLAGNSDAGFAGDGGPAALAQLSYPDGLLLTAKGDLLVADSGNHRIRKLTQGGPAVVPPAVQAPPVAEPVRVQFSLVHAALNRETPVAAGMLVTLYTSFELNPVGKLLFDGVAAKIVSRSTNQWNAVVPDSVAGKTGLTMEISDGTLVQAKRLVEIVPAMPGLFSAPGEVLHVLALHDNGTLNSITNPVPRNSIATIFATGLDGKASIGVTLAGRELLLSEPAVTMDGVTTIRFRVPGAYVGSGDQALSIKTGEARSLELNLRIE